MNTKTIISALLVIIVGVGVFYFNTKAPQDGEVFCTQEALLCPDGSYVGRSGPECAFLACPQQESFTGELSQTGDGFFLILPSPDPTLQEVTYALPLELRVSNALRDLVGKKVTARGTFTEGATYTVETLEEASDASTTVGTLRVGESKLINRVRVTLDRIVSDSRCPIDALCIQAGAAVARVTLKSDTDTATADLTTDGPSYAFDSFAITLVSVAPARRAEETVAESQYTATISVVPLE